MAGTFDNLERQFTAKNKLFSLSVDLTWQCDLACRHCYLSQKSSRDTAAQLDSRIALSLLDDAQALGALTLLLSGGEPFLHPGFWTILQRAKQHHFFTSVFTNAGLIDEACAKELHRLSVMDVGVSLYSHRASIHEGVTGVPGSHNKTLGGIRALLAEGVHVTIKTPVLAGHNDKDLDDFMAWVEALGPRVRHSLSCDIAPRDNKDWRTFKLKPDLTESVRILAAIGRRDEKLVKANRFDPSIREKRLGSFPCKAGASRLHVRADGKVTPCVELVSPIGDLERERLPAIWQRIKAPGGMHFLPLLGQIKACTECEHLDRCTPCVGLGIKQKGDITDTPVASCFATYARLLLENPACRAPKPLAGASCQPAEFVCGSSFCSRSCND